MSLAVTREQLLFISCYVGMNVRWFGQFGQFGHCWTISTTWAVWTVLDNMDIFGQFGHFWTTWTFLDNLDIFGQLGHSWIIRTVLDNFGHSWTILDILGQFGQLRQFGQYWTQHCTLWITFDNFLDRVKWRSRKYWNVEALKKNCYIVVALLVGCFYLQMGSSQVPNRATDIQLISKRLQRGSFYSSQLHIKSIRNLVKREPTTLKKDSLYNICSSIYWTMLH